MNTIELVGIRDHPIIEKKLNQNSCYPCPVRASFSVLGSGLKECLTLASMFLVLRIAFVVQLVTMGTKCEYLLLLLMKNEYVVSVLYMLTENIGSSYVV